MKLHKQEMLETSWPLMMVRLSIVIAVSIVLYGAVLNGASVNRSPIIDTAPIAAKPAKIATIKQVEYKSLAKVDAVEAISAPLSSTSHTDLMKSVGIASSDYSAVEYIISHESGWNASAVNTEGSGATGLCQALPASKMASAGADYLTNPVTQLKWCTQYATERYGSWNNALAWWQSHKWW